MSLEKIFTAEIQLIENYLSEAFAKKDNAGFGLEDLESSIRYSLLSGGKRFRPLLSLLTAKALGVSQESLLPYATAVELVHTYSLIHDDLPAMDDDDERRGQPTNHKVYGEAMAILAGDSLLTEAFGLIAEGHSASTEKALAAVVVLARAAGSSGMVGGQAIDIKVADKNGLPSLEDLKKLHAMKTGALITAAVEGAAILCGANEQEQVHLKVYGQSLGMAFQLADDILDHDEQNPEPQGFPTFMGLKETKAYLEEMTTLAVHSLSDFGVGAEPLREVARFNQARLN